MQQQKKTLIVQKVPGYRDTYIILGGPQPQVVTKEKVAQNIEVLKGQLGLQRQIIQKMQQLDMREQQMIKEENKVQIPARARQSLLKQGKIETQNQVLSRNAQAQKQVLKRSSEEVK